MANACTEGVDAKPRDIDDRDANRKPGQQSRQRRGAACHPAHQPPYVVLSPRISPRPPPLTTRPPQPPQTGVPPLPTRLPQPPEGQPAADAAGGGPTMCSPRTAAAVKTVAEGLKIDGAPTLLSPRTAAAVKRAAAELTDACGTPCFESEKLSPKVPQLRCFHLRKVVVAFACIVFASALLVVATLRSVGRLPSSNRAAQEVPIIIQKFGDDEQLYASQDGSLVPLRATRPVHPAEIKLAMREREHALRLAWKSHRQGKIRSHGQQLACRVVASASHERSQSPPRSPPSSWRPLDQHPAAPRSPPSSWRPPPQHPAAGLIDLKAQRAELRERVRAMEAQGYQVLLRPPDDDEDEDGDDGAKPCADRPGCSAATASLEELLRWTRGLSAARAAFVAMKLSGRGVTAERLRGAGLEQAAETLAEPDLGLTTGEQLRVLEGFKSLLGAETANELTMDGRWQLI
eukprot:gnl/TRDRNA2_/TRDRNA2_29081_c0_seq1.p1 gnl/TRDRNA2_/TRDRNA2_29081_c0~~gnl/TRDRNA2_/TRDRNA2_29081_c0_seq1.p1  ORF type:complete len:482 (+),score=69.47 gnl/TRDRNA2_/TRDRNA2_29081_c0_seq1:68-1447(+)